jgi:hypothetical protein
MRTDRQTCGFDKANGRFSKFLQGASKIIRVLTTWLRISRRHVHILNQKCCRFNRDLLCVCVCVCVCELGGGEGNFCIFVFILNQIYNTTF